MPERGPDAQYTEDERRAQGNPGRRVLPDPNDAPPPATADIDPALEHVPDPPAFLHGESDTAAMALGTWRAITPLLVEARALRESDLFSLARYCQYCAEWVALTRDIDANGWTVTNETKNGFTQAPNPCVMARQRVESAMAALEQALGLNPSARLKVQKSLMASLKDLPLAGRAKTANRGGAVGFLSDDTDDEDDE